MDTVFDVVTVLTALAVVWLMYRQVAMDRERREAERKHAAAAQLVPSVEQRMRSSGKLSYVLAITNKGQGEARRIRVELNGERPTSSELLHAGADEIETLGAGAHYTYNLVLTLGSPRPERIVLWWDDDTGRDHRVRSTLSL